jgi:hypothetical protein
MIFVDDAAAAFEAALTAPGTLLSIAVDIEVHNCTTLPRCWALGTAMAVGLTRRAAFSRSV